jgi:hypothetical protein
MENAHYIEPICDFLSEIGIQWEVNSINQDTFLPGLLLEHGGVTIDLARLKYPGDILHEAGHIALTAPAIRAELGQAHLDETAAHASEEMGVLLWSWLAARHLGIPADVVFHEHGYKGQADWLVEQFESGNHIGLSLLQWMGIVKRGNEGKNPDATPEVDHWLRQE